MSNNFILTFGKQPYNFINRFDDTNKIIESFMKEEPTEQLYLITGVRGSGKTVLLSNASSYFEEQSDWIVVDLNPNNDLQEELVSKLYQNSKLRSLFLKKELSFSFHGLSIKIEGETPTLTADCWIEKIVERLTKENKKILITIDEVTSTASMRSFAHMFQSLLRKNYSVFMLMTGLYENISELQNNKSLTFLYRAPKIYLTSLNLVSVANSYKNIFEISMEEAMKLTRLTCGYAFAYQLLGYLLQKNNIKNVNDDILSEYDDYLSQYIYEKLWSELTNVEKDLLKLFQTDGDVAVKDLVIRSNKSSSFVNLYRDRLIKKGIINSPSYGFLRFSLPRFKNYIESISY